MPDSRICCSWRWTAARSRTRCRWEPSRGGDLFPHLYGELPLDAVLWVKPLPLGPDGAHVFPPLEAGPVSGWDVGGLGAALLRRLDAETAHGLAIKALKAGLVPSPRVPDDTRLATRIAGIALANPLGLAAGFDKNAEVPGPSCGSASATSRWASRRARSPATRARASSACRPNGG